MIDTNLKTVALLPMKANSERVKGKNFKMFAGKPLYRWILDTLLASPLINQIVINTDARSILKEGGLVETEKIIIRDRKPEICGDFVSMNKVLADDIQNVPADIYLMTHTTNPLLTTKTVQSALNTYIDLSSKNQIDSLFTANKFQTRFYKADSTPINHDPNNLIRTQDLEPWFEENSNLYIFTKNSFLETSARIGKKPHMFTMEMSESVDIDNQESWMVAEAIAEYKKNKGLI